MQLKIYNGFNKIKQGDTKSEFKFQVLDYSELPIDLTGETVNIIVANSIGKILEKAPTIDDALTGIISFSFEDTDVTGYGDMRLEVHITDAAGLKQIVPSDGYYKFKMDRNLNDASSGVTNYTLQYFQSTFNGWKTEIDGAVEISTNAETTANSVQEQFNQVVIEGDSSVEAAQARVDSEGVAKTTLKQRLDDDYNSLTTDLAQTTSQLVDIVTVKPSGNANTDTVNIQNAINTARTVKFQNKKDNPFLVNAPIIISPIDETTTNVSSNGRIIDFQNCTIKAVGSVTNVFKLIGSAFPNSIKNLTMTNVLFDGVVTDSFIYVGNSFASFCSFEKIFATYDATGDSLIRFENTDVSGQLQGGIHALRHIRAMNKIKNTIRFSKVTGANSIFDDLIIEDVSSRYIGNSLVSENFGRCICVDDGCIITVSKISRLFTGGYGYNISLGAGSSLLNCTINQLYVEPLGTNAYGIIGGSLSFCTIDSIRLYLGAGQSVTTFARGIYSSPIDCTISNIVMDVPGGLPATGVYYEETGANSKGNTLSKIGNDPLTRIKLYSTDATTKVEGHYNAPYLFAKGGNLVSDNTNVAKNINLIAIPKVDINSCNILRIKVKGECNNNALNVFKLKLTGTGVDIDLLNCTAAIAPNVSSFELETDIYVPNAINIYVVSRSTMGNAVYNPIGAGTPLRSPVVTPDDLKVILSLTNSSYINILGMTVEKINNVLKPLSGGSYAQ